MNFPSNNDFGQRLKLARKMAGLSLQQLADVMSGEVSKQALSKYENGLMKPSALILSLLSKSLKVNPDFFLKKKTLNLGKAKFRKRAALSKRKEESIIEKVRDFVERFQEIENILNIAQEFVNPLEDDIICNKKDAEKAAVKLREKWLLGTDSIPNLVEMLELNGIKLLLSEEDDKFDGLAVYSSTKIPIVAINTLNRPIERIRFTIIHELAHIILKMNNEVEQNNNTVEKICHHFASCFLIPSNQLVHIIGKKRSYIKIHELISVKESFGISLRAIVFRLKDMEVISKDYYTRWLVWLSKEYGSKNEPGNYPGIEKSKVFDRLVNRALAEEIISISKASNLWNIPISKIRKDFNSGRD